LFSAARAESVSFNLLHKSDNSRIKQVTFCQAEDKPIPRSDLVKGYEYEKDRYVVIEDDEIKKVAPKTAKVMEILEFVETKDIDPVYLESSYYMAPEGGGEKAYALLFDALRKTGYSGVAKIAMHNREHIVILRPGPRHHALRREPRHEGHRRQRPPRCPQPGYPRTWLRSSTTPRRRSRPPPPPAPGNGRQHEHRD